MKKKLLLVYNTMGPTSRERSVINILDNLTSYSYFDVLLMTDYKEDPVYNSIRHLSNIIIKDIDELRNNHPWSIEHELLPIKTLNDEEYATYLVNKNMALSSCLWRFAFLLEGIEDYDGVLFCNTDIVFTGNEITINDLETSIKKFTKSTMFGHGVYDRTERFKNEFNFIAKHNNFQIKKDYLWSSDGNFFCYCFKSKNEMVEFFHIMNTIVYNILVEKIPELFFLARHTMWSLHSEEIQSIVHALTDIDISENLNIFYTMVNLMRYPEDRFWNWGIWLPSQEMKNTTKGKKHFIEMNYDLLKKYYEHYGQTWRY